MRLDHGNRVPGSGDDCQVDNAHIWNLDGRQYYKPMFQFSLGAAKFRKDNPKPVSSNCLQSSECLGCMMHIWPHFHPCLPVLKHELLWSGPFGIFCWLAGCVFLNRSNSAEARQLLNDKMNEMKEKKIKWWIFPEGTRNDQGFILPFKKGAFHIAVQSQIPIIPVVYSPYSEFYNPRERKFNTGKTIINVLPPVSTAGLTTDDISALSDRVRNSMVEEFSRYVNIKN